MSRTYKTILFDLSGVFYDGESPVAGAAEAVGEARRRGLLLRFVTNTATKTDAAIIALLARFGIAVEADELFAAPRAARAYLQAQQLRPYVLVHEAIRDEFASLDQRDPNAVLLGDARDGLSYAALNRAFGLCKRGCPLIAIGKNRYFNDGSALQLDAGAFVHALEWAAEVDATIMGKPSADFFAQVVASTACRAEQCLMVGDDIFGDIEGALNAGLQACLVRTGKYQPGDEEKIAGNFRVIESVAALFDG